MKYTMQELKDIYREASARSESEDYEHIAGRVECVLKGETKCCRFQLFEKDLISACFVEDDDACIVNDTYDEHVKRYGDHAELVMKMYGVKKTKAQTAETTEQAAEQKTVEGISEMETTTEADDSGHDKEVFEDETDEIECRCIWYHHNGVKGMIAQDTKRVIKKPETAEVSKEVVDNRKEVNSTSFIQQLYDAEYSKTLTVQGGIERFLKLAKEFVKNKSAEMSLIVDTAAQVLHDKYKLDYGTIEALEIEAYTQ